jgi:hypothetical protein
MLGGSIGFRLIERRSVSAIEQVFESHLNFFSLSGNCRDLVCAQSPVVERGMYFVNNTSFAPLK